MHDSIGSQIMRAVFVTILVFNGSTAVAQDWVATPIVGGYMIDVPKSWETKAQAFRDALDQTTKLRNPSITKPRSKIVFAAQLKHANGEQIGWVSVRTHPDYEKLHESFGLLTQRDLQFIDDQLVVGIERKYGNLGFKVIERFEPRRMKSGKYDTLLFQYRRKNPLGSTSFVRNLMVLNRERSIGIVMSDDERFPELRPVTDRILTSVRGRTE